MTLTIGIDPGHGMSSRKWTVYDPGAVWTDEDGDRIEEAQIALAVALNLRQECQLRGWRTAMSRSTGASDAPLRDRVPRFRAAQCDAIVSLHCNAHTTPHAHGTETLYLASEWVAAEVQRQLVRALGTRDRGVKQRDDLAILRYERVSILCELGFITHADDRALLVDEAMQQAMARAIASGLERTVRL